MMISHFVLRTTITCIVNEENMSNSIKKIGMPIVAITALALLLMMIAPTILSTGAYAIPPIEITREGGVHFPSGDTQKLTASQTTSTFNVATEAIIASK